MTAWASLTEARQWWPESAGLPDDLLRDLLNTATVRLTSFAPVIPAGDPIPPTYAHACALDARDLYAARLQTGPDGAELLLEGYTLRARRGPSAQVRELLRPTRPAVAR